jgi:hypothetical protein
MAERKAIQTGKVTRLLKETAVDCIKHKADKLYGGKYVKVSENQQVEMKLASGVTIPFKIGDKAYSETCDYMGNCSFSCDNANSVDESNLITSTYSLDFIKTNNDIIGKR